MYSWISTALTSPLLAVAVMLPAFAQDKSNTYSCEAFARMSGSSLPRTLPCIDFLDGERFYKSFNLYCEARSLQDDILSLQGCSEKYFKKQDELYGR